MTSTRENIIANVKSTLEAVATTNGYNYTLSGRVHRFLKHWDDCNEFPQVFVSDGEETKDYSENPIVDCFLTVVIRGYEHDTTDASTKINNLIEDIEKALAVDYTRGGYAVNTTPVSIATDEGWLTPHGLFEYRFEIFYQYLYGSS